MALGVQTLPAAEASVGEVRQAGKLEQVGGWGQAHIGTGPTAAHNDSEMPQALDEAESKAVWPASCTARLLCHPHPHGTIYLVPLTSGADFM